MRAPKLKIGLIILSLITFSVVVSWFTTYRIALGVDPLILTVPQGGSETATSPNLGDVLVGQADGSYEPQATSTLGHASLPVDLTTDVTGVLPISNGGTNQSTYVIGDILFADAADSLARLATSSAGSVLTLDLSTGLPSYFATSSLGFIEESTTASNLGTGAEVFSQLNGFDLQHRTLISSSTGFFDLATTTNNVTLESEPLLQLGSSRVFDGGEVTVNGGDNTKFDVSAGSGFVFNTHTDVNNPVFNSVSLTASTSITVTNIADQDLTMITVDKDGDINQFSFDAFFFDGTNRDEILIGTLVHPNRTDLSFGTTQLRQPGNDLSLQFADFARAVGDLNISGNTFSAATTSLGLKKGTGRTYRHGIQAFTNPEQPSITSDVAENPVLFISVFQDGSGGFTFTPNTLNLNVGFVDDGSGTLASLNNNQWQNFRVVFFAGATTAILIYHGQNVFNSASDASAARATESFVEDSSTVDGSHTTVITARGGATDLSVIADAIFSPLGKFGGVGGGQTTSTASLQDAYDNSTEPEILRNDTRGAMTIQNSSGDDTVNNFEIQNTAGTITGKWQANGLLETDLINATSTTATSTFSGNLRIDGGLSVGGVVEFDATFNNAGNITAGGIVTASNFIATSTTDNVFPNFTATSGTTTNATSTNISISGQFDVDNLTSALVITGSTGIFAEYTGTTCTNQFTRALSALGVATCETVSLTADVTGTLPVANGGTNATSLDDILGTSNEITVTNGANTIIGGDATLSLPSAVFLGTSGQIGRDADNLIDFVTDNEIMFRTNATDNRLIIKSDGNVGIGTTTPAFLLDVDGDFRVGEIGSANVLFVDATNGRVGIGETSPDATLEIVESGTTPFMISNGAAGNGDFFIMQTDGDIGLGITSPLAALDIVTGLNNGRVIRIEQTATSFSNNNYALQIDTTAHVSNLALAGAMSVDVNSGRAFTIAGTGNVGIGTSTPNSILDIGSKADGTDEYLQIDSEAGAPPAGDCTDGDGNEAGRMIIDHTNNVMYVCNALSSGRGWDTIPLVD